MGWGSARWVHPPARIHCTADSRPQLVLLIILLPLSSNPRTLACSGLIHPAPKSFFPAPPPLLLLLKNQAKKLVQNGAYRGLLCNEGNDADKDRLSELKAYRSRRLGHAGDEAQRRPHRRSVADTHDGGELDERWRRVRKGSIGGVKFAVWRVVAGGALSSAGAATRTSSTRGLWSSGGL